MHPKILIILAVAIVVVVAGIFFARQGSDIEPEQDLDTQNILEQLEEQFGQESPEPEAQEEEVLEAEPTAQPETRAVAMQGGVFTPATLEINAGDTVIFQNNGPGLYWPASNPHPTHTGLLGFDAQRALEPGESWSFTFTQTGSFGYHDHLNPSVGGTIVVR